MTEQQQKISKLAIASLIVGCCFIIPALRDVSVLALILAVVALREIAESKGALKGRYLAILGVALGCASLVVLIITSYVANRDLFLGTGLAESRLRSLLATVHEYARHHDGKYPTSNEPLPEVGKDYARLADYCGRTRHGFEYLCAFNDEGTSYFFAAIPLEKGITGKYTMIVTSDHDGQILRTETEGLEPDGAVRNYDWKGRVQMEYEMKDFQCTGMVREYFHGQISQEYTCDYDDKDTPYGIYNRYHLSYKHLKLKNYDLKKDPPKPETLAFKETYAYGKQHGPTYQYDKNGQLMRMYHYKNGVKHGPYEIYEDGVLRRKGLHKNGADHPLEVYNDEGNLVAKTTYHNDLEVTHAFRSNGELYRIIEERHDPETGKCSWRKDAYYFGEEQQLQHYEEYNYDPNTGKTVSRKKVYFGKEGRVTREENYDSKTNIEATLYYRDNGQLRHRIERQHDPESRELLSRRDIYYDEEGNIKEVLDDE